jgi:arylformamidase
MCAVDAPVAGVATLSGLHDLRPLVTSFVQEWLQLDPARAAALSPALLAPAVPTTLPARTGALETAEFKAQGSEFADAWGALGCDASYAETDDNHYSLFERLADPNDPVTTQIAELALAAGKRRTRVKV